MADHIDNDRLAKESQADREHFTKTVHELESRLSPGRLINEFMRSTERGPGDFAQNLGAQLRDKPLPAILTGAGLAWLMASRRDPHAVREDQARANGAPDGAARTGADMGMEWPSEEELEHHRQYDAYRDATFSTVRDEKEADTAYRRRLADNRAKAIGFSREENEDDDSFSRRVEAHGEKLKHSAHGVRTKLDGAARKSRDGIKSAGHATAHGAQATGAQAKAFHEEYPLATGAIGLAIGALMGSSLPLSREEFERMKGPADEAVRRGADAVKQASGAADEKISEAEKKKQDAERRAA